MSAIQSFFQSILPPGWAASMEAESRAWKLRCPCGHERSIWDVGGIRWKAAGNPRRWLQCPACGESTWHVVTKTPGAPAES
jgi:hypothetical protein